MKSDAKNNQLVDDNYQVKQDHELILRAYLHHVHVSSVVDPLKQGDSSELQNRSPHPQLDLPVMSFVGMARESARCLDEVLQKEEQSRAERRG